ncbi:MAG: nitronate monooxygenase family protein [Myxococcota bacterium]|nr:nitronate monooxygenase family protein [Myxococcota bacterium]
MLKTRFTHSFGIDVPVVQQAMPGVSGPDLVAAVAEAGGLGLVPVNSKLSFDDSVAALQQTRLKTHRSFGVSLGRLSQTVNVDALCDVLERNNISIVEISARSPFSLLETLKSRGHRVINTCGSVRQAKDSQKAGADAVIIECFECAGHRTDRDVGAQVLVPAVVDALRIPIIAAGGFVDGRGLVSALALGADAIAMQTRFLITQESTAHDAVKGCLLQSYETDTLLVRTSSTQHLRALKTPVSEKSYRMERRLIYRENLETFINDATATSPFETGDLSQGLASVGQSIGRITDIPTVHDLIQRIVSEADCVAARLQTQSTS